MFFILINPVSIRMKFNRNFDEYVKSIDGELTIELKDSYLNDHLDKKQLFDLDQELMNSIVKFYDDHIQ